MAQAWQSVFYKNETRVTERLQKENEPMNMCVGSFFLIILIVNTYRTDHHQSE